MKDDANRTFFHPTMRFFDWRKHTSEMPHIAALTAADGVPVLDALSASAWAKLRLSAMNVLNEQLEGLMAAASPEVNASALAEYLRAAKLWFHHFAVEDTEDVASRMAAFLTRLYRSAVDITDDEVFGQRVALLAEFHHTAMNSSRLYGAAQKIPKQRAEALAGRLNDMDSAAAEFLAEHHAALLS